MKPATSIAEYQEYSHYYRGKLIGEFCNLELAIERYLAKWFYNETHPKPKNEIKELILDRLTFEAKRTCFKAMLNKISQKNGFIKNKGNKNPYSALLDEIRKLNEHRVYFAHYYLAIPYTNPSDIIILVEYRDSTKLHSYDLDKFNDVVERIRSAVSQVEKLSVEHYSI